jgi:hypothetical protein
MSNFNDKALRGVADVAAKIMGEALKGNQTKIDANHNGKIDGQDFKILRAKKTMKEAELDEASYSAKEARAGKDIGKPGKEFSKIAKSAGKKYGSEEAGKRVAGAVLAKLRKEEAEQLDEISTKTLAAAAHAASDPEASYAYGIDKSMKHDPQKYADHAKKHKDAKSAAAVQGAADAKGHYPRPGHTYGGYDKLKSRENRSTNPNMVTKAGKLSKTSQKGLKSSLKEEEYLEEGGMPSSVIKHKQSLATKTPEQLHSGFKEVAGRMGKSVEHVARSTAWSHGYGKGEGKGSAHYWNKVKHLEEGWNDHMDDPNRGTPEQMRHRADISREKAKNQLASTSQKPKKSTYTLGFEGKAKTITVKKEEVEQIDEYNSTGGVYKHKGKYGYQGTGAEHGVTDHEKDNDMDDLDYQKKSKKLGARQNMGKRGQSDGTKKKKTNESFTAMLEMYNEHGLKYLAELSRVEEDVLIDETPGQDIQVINADIQNGYAEMTVEEVDNETFTKEMKDQEAKMNGKKKGGDVAKSSVQAVKQEEVEQIDELKKSTVSSYIQKKFGKMSDEPVSKNQYGYAKKDAKGIQRAGLRMSGIKATQKEEVEQMDERTLSSDETEKKEKYVKSMKKGLSGFKDRYGDKAKSVMYATATKMAKKD